MKSLDKIRYKFTKKSGKVAYIQLIINCGSDNDTIAGIAHLVEHLFLKVELNNSCLKDDINSIGAKITGRCMHKKTIFTICFKREEIETLKTIIESAINNIESCAQYYEREKFIVLEELNIKLNDLEWKLSNYVYNIYSNDKDRTILGNENSINSITKENILEFIKLNYTIDNMFINCIGDFKESIGASSNIHFLNIKDNYIYIKVYGKENTLYLVNYFIIDYIKKLIKVENIKLIEYEEVSFIQILCQDYDMLKKKLYILIDMINKPLEETLLKSCYIYIYNNYICNDQFIMEVFYEFSYLYDNDMSIDKWNFINRCIFSDCDKMIFFINSWKEKITAKDLIVFTSSPENKNELGKITTCSRKDNLLLNNKSNDINIYKVGENIQVALQSKDRGGYIFFSFGIKVNYKNKLMLNYIKSGIIENLVKVDLNIDGNLVNIRFENSLDTLIIYGKFQNINAEKNIGKILNYIFVSCTQVYDVKINSSVYDLLEDKFRCIILKGTKYDYDFAPLSYSEVNELDIMIIKSFLYNNLKSIVFIGNFSKESFVYYINDFINKTKEKYIIDDIKSKEFTNKKILYEYSNEIKHNMIGARGVSLSSDYKYPLHIIWQTLEGSNGRLFKKIREENNLAYAFTAFSREFESDGYFVIYTILHNSKVKKVNDLILFELDNIKNNLITQQELNIAKEKLIFRNLKSKENPFTEIKNLTTYFCADIDIGYYYNYVNKIKEVRIEDVELLIKEKFHASKVNINTL